MNIHVNSTQKSGKRVPANAVATLQHAVDLPLVQSGFYDMLYVICAILDEAAQKGNSYVLFGATRDQTALTVSVQSGGEKETKYAPAGIAELQQALQGFLEP